MIRLLTAVLLFSSFDAVAEVTLTELNNNTPADADDVMDNFNALKNEIESLPTPPTDCTADQIIKWDGSAWVCVTEPITATLIQDSWEGAGNNFQFKYADELFDSFTNIGLSSGCNSIQCSIVVSGIADHRNCVAQVTGTAVSNPEAQYGNSIMAREIDIALGQVDDWGLLESVYIHISCAP